MSNKRPLTYADGLGTGVAVIGLIVIGWLSSATDGMGEMYSAMGPGVPLAASTELVLSTVWRVGVPAALVASLVAAHVWRRPRYALIVIAVVTLGVVAFWYYAAYEPIFRISGNIR